MKEFTKLCLMLGGGCAVAGIGLCICGSLLGYEPGSILGEYREKEARVREGSYELSCVREYENITSLKVEVGAANCSIRTYDGTKVRVAAENDQHFQVKESGGTLKVSYGAENLRFLQDFLAENFITIYLPRGETLDRLEVDGGAANIVMEEMDCERAELEIGAGTLSYQGSVEKELSVDCGLGSVNLELQGKADDFNYDLDCGLGSISVERGPNIGGVGENKLDNKASKKMRVECGMGSVNVGFSEM